MISSAPGTMGEEAVFVALGQVCAAPAKNTRLREEKQPVVHSHFTYFTSAALIKVLTWCRSAVGMS